MAMNIMISVDSNYILPAKIMVKSMSLNTEDNIELYLLYSQLSNSQIEDFEKFCLKNGEILLHPVFVEEYMFEWGLTNRFSVEACFRLIAPFILPENVEKILWLDADIIVQKDIAEYYYRDLGTSLIGVVKDQGSEIVISECCKRIHLNKNSVYFNSGVILFNLTGIRKYWTEELLFDLIKKVRFELEYPDQDILNIMFENDKILFSDEWNYQIKSWSMVQENDLINASIIHYVGPIKPWEIEYENKGKWVWWNYYCMCFGKGKFSMYCVTNTWKIFYARYLERKIFLIKNFMKKILIK